MNNYFKTLLMTFFGGIHGSVVVSLCILILATQAFPQSVDLATLSGHIEDPSGAAVAGTVVQLLHVDRNQSSRIQERLRGTLSLSLSSGGRV